MDESHAPAFLEELQERQEKEPDETRRQWLQRLAGNVRKYLLEFASTN